MLRIAVIFVGAGLGGVLRHLLAAALQSRLAGNFPHGTLWVNLLGSLAIGLLIGLHERGLLTNESALSFFLTTGLCGGFTTMSTFSADTLGLLRERFPLTALGYAGLTLLGCLTATALGIALGRMIAARP